MLRKLSVFTMSAVSLWVNAESRACEGGFDIVETAPVGSWQLSRQESVGRGGSKISRIIRTSMLAKEQREEEVHYWIELATQPVEYSNKGEIKSTGDKFILLSLVPESELTCIKESLLNLNKYAVESIVQFAGRPPTKVAVEAKASSDSEQASGSRPKQILQQIGEETVTLNSGIFDARKLHVKAQINNPRVKVRARNDMIMWYSNNVPFGVVKIDGTSVMNGAPNKESRELLDYGLSGAKTEMTNN